MVKVYAIDGITPVVHADAYVHPSAVLIGDVIIAARAYIGPAACLRGDFGRIVIGEGANIQDTCVLHGFPDRDMIVEADGHIGHGAILHGCVIRHNAMVGINAVVNDYAVVGESAMVGAMAFVRAEAQIPARMLAIGIPARVVRELTEAELAWKRDSTRQYQELAARSLATLTETSALREVEPGRRRYRDDSVMPLAEMKRAADPDR